MKILVTDGFVAANVGNAFYRNGLKYFLNKALPEAELYFIGDIPANAWTINGRPPRNEFNYLKYFDPDYLVFSGPCLHKYIAVYFKGLFDCIYSERKTKIIFLGVGGCTYDSEEVGICRRFLERYPPFMLFTRDEVAYRHYHDLAKVAYNGIDFAFFINDYHKCIPTLGLGPYITMAFDAMREPEVRLKPNTRKVKHNGGDPIAIDMNEENLEIGFKETGLLVKAKLDGYIRRMTGRIAAGPERIGPYMIIRPTHSAFVRDARQLFAKKNTYVSEVPDGYLNLYRYTSLNLTDRVHSAIASLVWGNPTRLFTKSKRANLFGRIGGASVLRQITRINKYRLTEEKEKEVSVFRKAF